jgi:hypothetical protein
MERGFDIPLVGVTIPWKGVKIPHAGDLIHHRQGVRKAWVGVLYTMDSWVPYTMDRGLDVTWVDDSIYHGEGFEIPCVGDQNIMGRGLDVPWVGGSKYHG